MAESEATILREILLAIGARPDCRVWRVNTGVARDPVTGRVVRFGTPGGSDIQGIVAPSGRFIGLEVKSKSGQVSAEQRAWGEMVRRNGGFWDVVRSVADAERAIEEAKKAS
jgi:hypothetical protein